MAAYSIAQAETQLPKLIEEALRGEPVTLLRDGLEVAELVAKTRLETQIDVAWLRTHLVQPASASSSNAADLVRAIRDGE